jgi:hypothetical protein
MTVKRDAPKQKLDGAVEAAISENDPVFGGMERRRRARNRTAGEAKKAQRDQKRIRATYDLPRELIDAVVAGAERELIPDSQFAAAMMIEGLKAYAAGQLDLQKVGSRSPLYDFVLVLPGIPKIEG